MGYRRDAQVARLMTYLRHRKETHSQIPIAWLYASPKKSVWTRYKVRKPFWQAASRHALNLGYKIEQYWLSEPGMSPRRLQQIMLARGVKGILLAPPQNDPRFLEFDYSHFASAEFQNDIQNLGFNSACPDFTHNFDLAWMKLQELGYKRPGYCCIPEFENLQNHLRSRSFLWMQQSLPEADRIPIFHYSAKDDRSTLDKDRKAFAQWMEAWRPDVIISATSSFLNWVTRTGLKVPDEVAFVSLNVEPDESVSGIDLRKDLIAEAVVDLVIGHLNRGETGRPPDVRSVHIKGAWQPGKTLRKR